MASDVSDFLESLPKVSSNHCFRDSSNGRLRVLTDHTSFLRSASMNLFFDRIQGADSFQCSRCHRRLVRFLQIVKFPAHMRPTGRFLNPSCFVKLLEPRVTIGL